MRMGRSTGAHALYRRPLLGFCIPGQGFHRPALSFVPILGSCGQFRMLSEDLISLITLTVAHLLNTALQRSIPTKESSILIPSPCVHGCLARTRSATRLALCLESSSDPPTLAWARYGVSLEESKDCKIFVPTHEASPIVQISEYLNSSIITGRHLTGTANLDFEIPIFPIWFTSKIMYGVECLLRNIGQRHLLQSLLSNCRRAEGGRASEQTEFILRIRIPDKVLRKDTFDENAQISVCLKY